MQICGRDRRDRWGSFAYSASSVATVAGIVDFARGVAREARADLWSGSEGSLGVFQGGAQDRGRESRFVTIIAGIVGFRVRDRAGSQAREAKHMRLSNEFLGRSCRHGFNEICPSC